MSSSVLFLLFTSTPLRRRPLQQQCRIPRMCMWVCSTTWPTVSSGSGSMSHCLTSLASARFVQIGIQDDTAIPRGWQDSYRRSGQLPWILQSLGGKIPCESHSRVFLMGFQTSIVGHHDSEEEVLFPFLNTKLDFSTEIEQHVRVAEGLTNIIAYIDQVSADHSTFSAAKLKEMMESLGGHLVRLFPSNKITILTAKSSSIWTRRWRTWRLRSSKCLLPKSSQKQERTSWSTFARILTNTSRCPS